MEFIFSEVFLLRSSLLSRFVHTLARTELDLDRRSLESEYLTDLVLDIANIGEVEVIRIIHRDQKFRRIRPNL